MSATIPFKDLLAGYQHQAELALQRWLPGDDEEPRRLHQAMRYAVLNGGKRVRPVLVYASGHALGATLEQLHGPACALELIHAYSLVHDDLPAMDNDDLRRGKPTCHKAYDEATAILVGDALQSLAFQILADDNHIGDVQTRLRMVSELALASGSRGMCGGQAIDLESVGQQLDQAALENMHLYKTGALIRAGVLMGAYAAGAEGRILSQLAIYARCIGLSFQVQDDILDVEGETDVIGKTRGADMARGKPTYPALLGLDGAKKVATQLHEEALEALADLGPGADFLRQLSAYIVQRSH